MTIVYIFKSLQVLGFGGINTKNCNYKYLHAKGK